MTTFMEIEGQSAALSPLANILKFDYILLKDMVICSAGDLCSIDCHVGLLLSWRNLAFSAGLSTMTFKTCIFSLGIGVRL